MILIIMYICQIMIIKKIKKEKDRLQNYLRQAKEQDALGLFSVKIASIITSTKTFFVSIIFVIIYILTMFLLGCLEITITGLYGGFLGAIVFYVGIYAYAHYISLIYFVYDLRNLSIRNYFIYSPALTEWLGKLAQLFSFIEKWFLALGVLYVTIYAINLPSKAVILKPTISLNTQNDILFVSTWSGILLFFVLAFPFLTFYSRNCIKHVIDILKTISIRKFQNKIELLSKISAESKLETIEKYLSLIKTIDDSPDYPLKSSRTLFDSFYSIIMAFITLTSPYLSIIENIMTNK